MPSGLTSSMAGHRFSWPTQFGSCWYSDPLNDRWSQHTYKLMDARSNKRWRSLVIFLVISHCILAFSQRTDVMDEKAS